MRRERTREVHRLISSASSIEPCHSFIIWMSLYICIYSHRASDATIEICYWIWFSFFDLSERSTSLFAHLIRIIYLYNAVMGYINTVLKNKNRIKFFFLPSQNNVSYVLIHWMFIVCVIWWNIFWTRANRWKNINNNILARILSRWKYAKRNESYL